MDLAQVDWIANNLVGLLCKNTICTSQLLSILQQNGILSQSDYEDVKLQKTSFEKSRRLYEILPTRKGAFEILKTALQTGNQSKALELLQQTKSTFQNFDLISVDINQGLGTGRLGTRVYRGKLGEREVAVKVVMEKPEQAMKEVNILRKLDDHENIVRYFMAEKRNDKVYIALELCCINLEDELKIKLLKPNPLEVIKQCTKGLAFLHRNEIVHRDLKPTNILLNRHGQVKISDFGFSKQFTVDMSLASISGVVGTPDWMAPELLGYVHGNASSIAARYSIKADIFSLGCIFYFVLSNGKHLFGDGFKRPQNIIDNAPQWGYVKLGDASKELIRKMIARPPKLRATTDEILRSKYFQISSNASCQINQDKVSTTIKTKLPTVDRSSTQCKNLKTLLPHQPQTYRNMLSRSHQNHWKKKRNPNLPIVKRQHDKLLKAKNTIRKSDTFNDMEAEKVKAAFDFLKHSTESFQFQWLKYLEAKINQAHEQFKSDLETILVKAMDTVAQEISDCEIVLSQCTVTMTVSETATFHKTVSTSILQKFDNPFVRESLNYKEIEGKLQSKLESTFQKNIQNAKVLEEKAQSKLDNLSEQAHARWENEIQQKIIPQNVLSAESFQESIEVVAKSILDWFDNQTQDVNAAYKTEAKQKLLAKFDTLQKNLIVENNDKIARITNLASELFQNYDFQMNSWIQNDIHSSENLLVQHEKVKASVIETFLCQCPTNNTSFVSEQLGILEAQIMERLPEIQGLFEITQAAANIEFSKALMEAKKIYQENMDHFFANQTKGFFVEEDLLNRDSVLQKSIFEKLANAKPLTQHVISKLEHELTLLFCKYQEKNELNRILYYDDEPAIGIDLGTSYCCVAVNHLGTVKIIPNSTGSNVTPSYITIQSDGSTPVVGQIAKDRAYKSPESTIFDAKRIIGRQFDDKKLQDDIQFWPFCIEEIEGFANIKVNGKYYSPEEISAMILKRLKKDAEEFLVKKVEKAVITVPAYFTDGQRQATINAGELAGLKVLALLNEPTAAAVAYRLSWFTPGTSRKVLVYDLGGGTFDVAILEMTEDKIEVLSVDGDSHLGGEDFDKDLMEYGAREFENETGINLFENLDHIEKRKRDEARRCVKRLQLACENAKRTFTSSRTASVSMDEIVRGQDLNLDIMRNTFYDRNMALFETTIEIVDRALDSAGITKDEIDDIVMVGGSTRILKLQEMLQEHFSGKALMKNLNPDEAVAVGAAVQAAILNAKPGAKIFDFGQIQDVTPMSLGIKIATDEMHVLIPKNTKLPAKYTQQYKTQKSGQTGVTIRIYQGEDNMADNNTLLGTFKLEDIPANTTEKETIDVTMKINLNGILEVEALCRSNNVKSSITVSEKNRGLSPEKKARLLAELPP